MAELSEDKAGEGALVERYCQVGETGLQCVTYKQGHDVPEVEPIEHPFENKMYRVSDAEAVERLLQDRQIVLIEAPMGAGKSSVMKSLIALYDPSEILFFQGHRFGSEGNATDKLRATLAECTGSTRVLVVDSADYLYQDKQFINAGKGQYDERSRERIQILADFLRTHPEIRCVLPIHDENWAKVRANPELKEAFDANFRSTDSSAVFNPSYYVNSTHVVRFLEHDLGFTRDQAWFIANIYKHPVALDTLNEMGYLKRTPNENGNTFQDLLRSSMITAQMFKRFPKMKDRLQQGFAEPQQEAEFVKDYVKAALAIDYRSTFLPIIQQTRKKQREAVWGTFDTLDGSESDGATSTEE